MKPKAARLAAATLAAVLSSSAAGSDAPPVFPSRVELVTVDAVVVDASGAPITGLTREDFTVIEDGVPQEIATFEAVSLPEPAAVAGPAPAERPLHVATNVAPLTKRSTFLVVVDDIHLSAATVKSARTTLERFLAESVRAGDRVTIVSTGTRGAWSGTLPEDRGDLLEFVSRLKGQIVNAGPELMTDYEAMRIAEYNDTQMLERVMGRYYRRSECSTVSPCDARVAGEARGRHGHAMSRREASLAVIERAIEGMARLRGRKTVVFLSEGFIHDDRRERSYGRVVAAAQRTNSAVYFVDVRGVVGLSPYASAEAPDDTEPTNPKLPGREFGARAQNRMRSVAEVLYGSSDGRLNQEVKIGVETMADDTGGFTIRGTNDLAGGLAAIATEARSYYLLGYHPSNASRDGGFRRIQVRLADRGLSVRARRGYLAPGPEGEARREPRAEEPDPLVQAFEAAAEVPLRLATYALEPTAEGRTRVLAVTEIDVSALQTEDKGDRRVGHLDLRLEAIPRDGGETRVHQLSMEAELPVAASPGRGAWRPIRLEFELPSGIYRVRASVRDTASGASGIVAQRLAVTDSAAFRISTPILSDVVLPTGEKAVRDPAPLAHQQFAADTGRPLLCQFEVFGAARDPVSKRADVTLRLAVTDEQGRAVGGADPVPMAQSGDGRLRQLIALPVDRLAAGRYALTLVVEDRVAGARQEWRETFVIEPRPSSAGGGDAREPSARAMAAGVF